MQIRVLSLLLLGLTAATGWGQTIHLEAENARLEGPTLNAVRPAPPSPGSLPGRSGYSGAGYVTGFAQPTDRLVFKFKVKTAGLYDLRVAYSCDGRKGFVLEVNDTKISEMFPSTGGSAFAVHSVGKVDLAAGPNAIAIDRGWGYYDVDYIELQMTGPAQPPAVPLAKLADFHGSPEAAALLARLDESYGKGTMLGVYSDDDAKYVLDKTGYQPAIMGGDLMKYSPSFIAHGADPAGEVERLIADAKAGYAITLSWHWCAPFGLIDAVLPNGEDARWYKGFYTNATKFNVAVAMGDPASKEHAALLHDIDEIAVQLKKLEAAGVPVLWRPLHEAQDQTFWWGAKGPKPFVALWRMMYDRLVNQDGIHNLVWVFTSGGDPAWYPGDAYVDVVGIDAYPEDLHDPQSGMWAELQGQFYGRKPLAISEFGGVPDVPKMQRLGAFWSYAVSWQGDLGPRKNAVADLQRIYANDGSIKVKPAAEQAGTPRASQGEPPGGPPVPAAPQ